MADSQQQQDEGQQKPVEETTNVAAAADSAQADQPSQPAAAPESNATVLPEAAAAASSGETQQQEPKPVEEKKEQESAPAATVEGVANTAADATPANEAEKGPTTENSPAHQESTINKVEESKVVEDAPNEVAATDSVPAAEAAASPIDYQTNRLNRDEELRQSAKSGQSPEQLKKANTNHRIDQVERKVLDGLEKERKLATEMGQIPEAIEPEETARDQVKPSTSQGERDKNVIQSLNQVDGDNPTAMADMKYQTSPKAEFQSAAAIANKDFQDAAGLNPPQIEIDRESLEFDYSNVTPISINRELYLRLVKTAVLAIESLSTQEQIEASTETNWQLSQKQTGQYLNGTIFGHYLIFLKKHMKHTWNQIWSIKVAAIKELQQGIEEEIIKGNWQILAQELDKISINIQDDNLEAIYRADQKPIDMMFNRIERYSRMITDAQFLKYEVVKDEDKYNDGMDDTTVYNAAITDENLSEMISLRQQQTFRSNISKPSLLSKMITRGETKIGSKFILPPGINLPPQKSETMKTNNLRVRGQKSDDIMGQSVNSKEGGTYIKVAEDFGSEVSIKNGDMTNKSQKPATETLGTDIDVTASADAKQMENILIQGQNEPSPMSQHREPKKIKDGVDILALSADKDVSSCDSSLELILVTLSKSFLMSPKQAAALLTNNNQYLIIACIRGVKGGKFEPLLAWYDLLISNCETLAELLQLEMEQLPASAKQTFVKVMAAVGCGFFSSNIELVEMTLAFFTELFQRFQRGKSMQALEQATKWFLSDAPPQTPVNPDETTAASLLVEDNKQQNMQNQQEMINAGGLKLSVYALRKHQEVTRQTMVLYNVFFQSEEQAFMIYATEIQASTKTVLEYMELVGEFLPIMSEMWPETAINSGLVDYWLDLCSREAEHDFKVQNREKVLAISLLAEIWLLFTDYVDDKDEVTNTLIFVFKRTVSERTKSIRLLSIAYLFKILEKLIEMKKKAALTLYRTLIFSLIESPSDPTIRELYFTNFTDLFRANPKMPSEWLTEPLIKQFQAQLNITFSLKIFDFTFMAALIEHPKFNDEHATALFSFFAQISQDDTSYATAAHQIMLMTLQRFMGDQQADGGSVANKTTTLLLQERAQEHVRLLFDLLLDLEPITRAGAMTLMKRQQRQNALKIRQGAAAGRSSQASIGLMTPGSISTGKPPLKARDLLGSKSVNQTPSLASLSTGAGAVGGTSSTTKPNSHKDILRRHKKSLTITFLLKVQGLGLPQLNNNFLRELTFEKTREFKGVYGYFNKGHIELLKAYGDPDTLIADCQLDPQLLEQQQLEQSVAQENNNNFGNSLVPARKTSVRTSPYNKTANKAQTRGNGAGGIGTPSRNTSQHGSDARLGSQDSKDIVAVYEDEAENNHQLVPFTEQSSTNLRARSIGSRARALQEIEKIKKQKQDRDQRKIDEEQKLRVASAKRKKRLKIEIQKRKHALGIADKAQNKYALLSKEAADGSEQSRPQQRSKQVMYVKLDEEEDRDRDTVLEFMRKYQKLWRNIFAKYANTGHKANAMQKPTFDSKSQQLTYAEITKLLKDHGTYPQHISKEELSQMVRMINQKNEAAKSADIQSLTYQGYQSFIVQLAVHCFSKPPHNLSSAPMVKSIETLVKTFEEATRKRNLSTLLYEDPDAVVALTLKDKEMIRSLNQTVKEQPDYPMPEGFLKVKERVPVYDYSVPKATVPFIGEANAVCVEIVDELVNKLFDFHVLEPQVTMQEQYRVKPSMQRSLQKDSKPGERGNRAEALSIIRRAEEKQRGSIDGIRNSRGTNRSKLPKIGQQQVKAGKVSLDDLPPVYKKLVSKQPAAKKPIYEEVSIILENMIRKTCGEKELRPQMINLDNLAASESNPPTSNDNNLRENASSTDSKRNSIAVSNSQQKNNLVKILPPLDNNDLEDLDGMRYDDAKKLRDRQNALERRFKEKKRQERQKKLKEDLAKLKEERKVKEEEDKVHREEESKKKKEQDKKLEERRKKLREDQKSEALNKQTEEENKYDVEAAAAQAEQDRQKELKKQKEKREFFRKQQEKLNNQFKNMSEQRKADSEQQKQKVLKEIQQKQQLKNRIDQQNKLGQGHRERQLALDVANFISKPEVRQLFTDHEKSLLKYFKYYCRQNRVELGHDLQFRLEHLDFNSFNKLGLQSKIIPVLISSEQLKSTFRNTVKQAQPTNADLAGVQNSLDNIQPSQRANSSLDVASSSTNNASSSSQHIDFESFKKALVRIAILGQELLGGQSEEQRQRKAQLDEKRRQAELRKKELMKHRQEQRARLESETLTEMRQEYAQKQRQIQNVTSRSPTKSLAKVQSEPALNEGEQAAQVTINEEDFQRWLKQQDAIGNGLAQRVTEKMNKASINKPISKPVGGLAAVSNGTGGADLETPTKIPIADSSSSPQQLQFAEDDASGAAGQAEDGSIGAPLLRAKQSQQARNYQTADGAASIDGVGADLLDISFISVDTIKALFDFMHVEAGDEGERNIDQVLAAQSSLEGRGRPSNPATRRGISKEPTPATPTPAAVQQNVDQQ